MTRFLKWAKDVWNGDFEYREDIYDNSKFWYNVKVALCGRNKFANIMYLFWGDLDCPCCAFIRGLLIGGIGMYLLRL